jgi:hypothetical protein
VDYEAEGGGVGLGVGVTWRSLESRLGLLQYVQDAGIG